MVIQHFLLKSDDDWSEVMIIFGKKEQQRSFIGRGETIAVVMIGIGVEARTVEIC